MIHLHAVPKDSTLTCIQCGNEKRADGKHEMIDMSISWGSSAVDSRVKIAVHEKCLTEALGRCRSARGAEEKR